MGYKKRRRGNWRLSEQIAQAAKQEPAVAACWKLRPTNTKHTITVYQHGRIHLDSHHGRGGRTDLGMYTLSEQEPCPCYSVRRWLAAQLRTISATGEPGVSTFAAMAKGGIAPNSYPALTSLYGVQRAFYERMKESKFSSRYHQVKTRHRGTLPAPPTSKKEQYLIFIGRPPEGAHVSYYKDGRHWGEALPIFLSKGLAKGQWPQLVHARMESVAAAIQRFFSAWPDLKLASLPGAPQAGIVPKETSEIFLRRDPLGVEALRYGFLLFQRTLTYSYRWENEAGDGKVAVLHGYHVTETGILHARELVVEAYAGERPVLLNHSPLPQLPGQSFFGWDLLENREVTQEEAEDIIKNRIP